MAGRGWRIGRAAAVLAVLAAVLAGGEAATAATYTVHACGTAAHGENHLLSPSTSDTRLTAYEACPTDSNGHFTGVVAAAKVDAGTAPFFSSAMQTFLAPPGTTIRTAHVKAEGRAWNGDWSSLLQATTDRFARNVWNLSGCGGNPGTVAGCVSAHNNIESNYEIPGATGIRTVVGCVQLAGCTTFGTDSWPFTRAYYFVHEFDVTLDDFSSPPVQITGGGLADGRWVRGSQPIVFDSSDNSGIRRTRYWVDDRGIVEDDERICDYTRSIPCSNVTAGKYTLDTSTIVDGTHMVAVEAFDATDVNQGTNFQTIRVDNHAPSEPVGLSVLGGQGWHTQNDFRIDYAIPGGQVAPVTRAYYEICEGGGATCTTGSQDGNGIDHIDHVAVPQPGDYTLRVWLMDAAGNVSNAKSAPVRLRFDNVPPAQAQPERRNGWLNAVEAKSVREEIGKPTARSLPVSGISGYAVTTDGSTPGSAPNVPADAADDYKAAVQLEHLGEGTTTVRARAISGAGIPSGEIGSTDLHVDLTGPAVTVDDPPSASGWTRTPVSVRIRATDPGELSGMAGAQSADPDDAHGGFVTYAVDGGATGLVRGPAAAPDFKQTAEAVVPVFADGPHKVNFGATDLAGNEGDSDSISFKIDQTPPELVVFEAQQESDPRLITVAASDRTSGLADGATIELRRTSPTQGDWVTLRTTRDGDRYYAHVANNQLPEGDYEFRASVLDQAGNRARGDRNRAGESEVLHISPTQVGPYRTIDDGSVQNSGRDATDQGASIDTRLSAAIVIKARVVKRKTCKTVRGRKRKKCKTRQVRIPARMVHEATVAFGKSATIQGTLTNADGAAIPNVEVVVLSRLAADGARYTAEGSVRTDAHGAFTYTASAGPGRRIDFAYRGGSTFRQSHDEVAVQVPAAATIRASRKAVHNGGSVTFTGRLRGRPYPQKGKVLDLQAFYRGKWRTFATPRAAARGAWKQRYRFEATRGTVLYKFRLRVRATSDYPYETGYSKTVKVRVTGR